MRWNSRTTLIGMMAIGLWIGGGAVQAIGDDPQKGRPVYEKYCLLCHGPQGMGDGPQGQLLKPPAANFRSPQSKSKPDSAMLKTIREGHPDSAMTRWAGILSEEDMHDVLAYIRDLSGSRDKGL